MRLDEEYKYICITNCCKVTVYPSLLKGESVLPFVCAHRAQHPHIVAMNLLIALLLVTAVVLVIVFLVKGSNKNDILAQEKPKAKSSTPPSSSSSSVLSAPRATAPSRTIPTIAATTARADADVVKKKSSQPMIDVSSRVSSFTHRANASSGLSSSSSASSASSNSSSSSSTSPSSLSITSTNPSPARQISKKFSFSSAPKCFTCEKSVYATEMTKADDKVYHKTCFRCSECNKALEGKLYCKPHFKQLFKLKGNYSEGFGHEDHKKKWLSGGGPPPYY